MSQSQITVESDQRTKIEAETIRAGFLDQSFIPTMRFSELNGFEEYDNSLLWMLWHGFVEYGLQQIVQYNNWIIRELERMDMGQPENAIDHSLSVDAKKPSPTLDYIAKLLDTTPVKNEIPYDQRARIYRYFMDLSLFLSHISRHPGIPLDSEKVMWLMRTYLSGYNNNISDGIILYDGHYAILNGRMARGKGHKKDLLKVTENRKERDKQVSMGKHWWNRNKEGEEDGE